MSTDADKHFNELVVAKKQLEIIRNVSNELNKLTGLKPRLNNILQILVEQFGMTHSMILLPEKDNSCLSVYASRGYEQQHQTVQFGKGIIGIVADKRIPMNITGLRRRRMYWNVISGSGSENDEDLIGLKDAESQIAIPLLSNNELVAVLFAESNGISVFNTDDEKILLTLTTSIAISIQNSILYDSMEEKIKQRTAELEKTNRTKDRLFSIISHDLRSPVSSFQSITQLLKHYSSRGELNKIDSLSDKIEHSANRLNSLLDNLLSWSLSQSEAITCHHEAILLHPFLQEIVSAYHDAITAKILVMSVSIDPDVCVFGDTNTLSVVFRNLLSNAIKFTPRNGAISVSALRSGDVVAIQFSDNGIGMSGEQLAVAFTLSDRKSTIGTEKERGTGLGLVLVHEFVLLNNGTITAESGVGQGTTFIITLPAC